MRRFKIMVNTLQGQICFFCHWKMGNSYTTRLCSHRGDAIWYTESEINIAENYLKNHQEQLQVKSYSVEEISLKPSSTTQIPRPYTRIFGSNDRSNQRHDSIV